MCPKIKIHNVNRLVSLLVFICLTSFTYTTYASGNGQGAAVHTLVIDPGHGGMDPGAIGPGGHHESDLALAVSLKFGEMVKEAFPDVKIIYTRTTDKFVSLADRADLANKAKADLFICIHLNSALNHDAYGTATYVLGLHRTDDNLEIAKRENAVIELEGDKDKNYEFDPNSPEGHIIMSMKQNAFLDQSILIASKIEDELAELSKRKSRGVKQAGFWVLYKTAMPSLLAEIGFISNPTEEQYLATNAGQQNIASSIFKAFRSYKYEIEGIKDTNAMANMPTGQKKTEPTARILTPPIVQNANPSGANNLPKATEPPVASNQPPVSLNKQEVKKEVKIWQPDTTIVVASNAPPVDTTKPKHLVEYRPIDQVAVAIIDSHSIVQKKVLLRDDNDVIATKPKVALKDTITQPNEPTKTKEDVTASVTPHIKSAPRTVVKPKTDTITNTAKVETKPVAKPKREPTTTVIASATTENASQQTITKTTKTTGKEDVYFTIQLLAAKHKPGNYDDLVNTFGLMNREDIGDGVVRYMAGEFTTFSEAKKWLGIAHKKGIKDAFIVGYLNKKRLDGKGTYQLGAKYP
jgi:N-acetylmuramoyl-L-alanine amidase